ncbi:unnamed protein product [Brachionus calyciflorus]|uniref:Uncharacterized protein n=1 Tax=Brachionus calyciflorus TaxID=104777 RepID=A0A814MM95_9BILA|nr:unnamed protein product [Brachionus calyciflorus]
MLKYNLLAISLLWLIVPSDQRSNSFYFNSLKTSVGGPTDFDYLIFRQIWPASSCMFPGPNTCTIDPVISTWVVHGLWPSIKTEIGPSFCNKSVPFDFGTVKWLLPELLQYWPNLYTNTPLESFWKHEWEKHGTCALTLPQIQDQSDYFNVTLGLRNKFDFGPALKKLNIEPDDKLLYDLDKIKYAIRNYFRVEPMIVCYVLKDSDVQYLSQMQVCLSKDFQLVDCEFKAIELAKIAIDNKAQEIQCQPGIPIHYPTIKYTKSQLFKFKQN